MFIEYEETPNPDTLKFIPGVMILQKGVRDYQSRDDAVHSPLALRLFDLDGVSGVFLSGHYVSVSKQPDKDWDVLKPMIFAALMEHLSTKQPVLDEPEQNDQAAENANKGEEDSEIVRQIKEVLETRVLPAVAQDGGHIEFLRFEEGVVYLEMQGACAGCPSSTMTLKHGIENLLQHFIPEVIRVEQEAA